MDGGPTIDGEELVTVDVADVPSSAGPSSVRKRRGRDPWRDLFIPVLAIGAVVALILFVQWLRRPEYAASPAGSFVDASSGEYQAIQLGTGGGGEPSIGKPAPGFQLVDAQGKLVRLSDFRGQPVLINFWATWCVPCRKETPELVALQEEWQGSAQIVGVNYFESAEVARDFVAAFRINYPTPLDSNGEVTGSYKLRGLPETFFLDGDGIVRDHRIGLLRLDIARCVVAGIEAGNHDPKACR